MGVASINNRHFLMRRLHSLFGLLPVGGFLLFHLWENSQSRFGAEHYNTQVVAWLQGLNYLHFLEIFLIGLPLLWHALYGLVIINGGRAEPLRYPYLHNRLYLLQRISGLGILLFLLIHVGGTRVWGVWEPSIKADMFGHIQSLLSDPLILAVYLAGLLLAVFHLCYGIWSLAVSWGITTTPKAQDLMFKAVMVLALLLAVEGIHGIRGFLL